MQKSYDPQWIQQYYDESAGKEWERMVADPVAEVSLHVHTHYLRKHIKAGDRVLEIGAGAGRFTQVLAELGAKVCVADISAVQLDLNREYALELGFDASVIDRRQLDVCHMDALADWAFDAVVCYGGPLSYVFDQREQALREMLRVVRPGGLIPLSVMSLWGTVHHSLEGVLRVPSEENWQIIRTGDLRPQSLVTGKHHCHFFRATQFRDLLLQVEMKIEDLSACACLCVGWGEKLKSFRADPVLWNELLQMEVEACCEPGALDMGTHFIGVGRKSG